MPVVREVANSGRDKGRRETRTVSAAKLQRAQKEVEATTSWISAAENTSRTCGLSSGVSGLRSESQRRLLLLDTSGERRRGEKEREAYRLLTGSLRLAAEAGRERRRGISREKMKKKKRSRRWKGEQCKML